MKMVDFFYSRKEAFFASLRFGVLNFIVFALTGLYYRSQASLSSFSLKSELYTLVVFLGLPGCLALLLSLICALAALINRKAMYVTGILLSIFCTTAMFVDAIVFAQYNFHIDGAMISLFFSEAGTELVPFSLPMFLMAGGGFLAVAALCAGLMYAAVKFNSKYFTRAAIVMSVIFLSGTAVFHLWHAVVSFQGEQQMLERNRIFPCNIGVTANRLLLKLGFKAPEKQDLNIEIKSFAYPRKTLTFKADAKKYNIVFVLVDALRGDVVTPEIMPYFSSVVKEGAYFKNHLSNGNCTRVGVFSVFSGLPGTYWEQALTAQRGSVLVESLLKRDYQTGVFFSAALTNPEFDRTVFAQIPDMVLKRKGRTKIARDREATADFKKFILNRDKNKPLFAVLMLDALHGYEMPGDFKRRFQPAQDLMNYLTLRPDDPDLRLKIFNMLKNATSYSDVQLKEVIEFVRRELDMENTILVVTSDHGNECNEANNTIWGHNSKFSRYQLHVPLFLAGGPIEKGEFNHRTFHVDIVPTLLQKLGCENPVADYSLGQSLFELKSRDLMIISSYSNRAMLYGDIIYEMTGGGVIFNYDLNENNVKKTPDGKLSRRFFEMLSHFAR